MSNEENYYRKDPDEGFEPELPGVDPRIEALKSKHTMHTNPKSTINMTATDAQVAPTFAHLIDRLERQLQYTAQLGHELHNVNDRFAGGVPTDSPEAPRPDVESYLQYSHTLVGDIHNRLVEIEAQIKRLKDNIGE